MNIKYHGDYLYLGSFYILHFNSNELVCLLSFSLDILTEKYFIVILYIFWNAMVEQFVLVEI